jgi:hypothetical protein
MESSRLYRLLFFSANHIIRSYFVKKFLFTGKKEKRTEKEEKERSKAGKKAAESRRDAGKSRGTIEKRTLRSITA